MKLTKLYVNVWNVPKLINICESAVCTLCECADDRTCKISEHMKSKCIHFELILIFLPHSHTQIHKIPSIDAPEKKGQQRGLHVFLGMLYKTLHQLYSNQSPNQYYSINATFFFFQLFIYLFIFPIGSAFRYHKLCIVCITISIVAGVEINKCFRKWCMWIESAVTSRILPVRKNKVIEQTDDDQPIDNRFYFGT